MSQDPGNYREALRECRADEAEGADILMVKPAGAYLDVVRLLRDNTTLPVSAYQVRLSPRSAEQTLPKKTHPTAGTAAGQERPAGPIARAPAPAPTRHAHA